jgi:hypothetical protein
MGSSEIFYIVIPLILMCVFILRVNTTFRRLYIQFSSSTSSSLFGHRHVDFITLYVEKLPRWRHPLHISLYIYIYICVCIYIYIHL